MTAGYNAAMKESDAKYKIYMHQDAYILNKNFLLDLLDIFRSDEEIGLVGMIGSTDVPESLVWWESDFIVGCVYDSTKAATRLPQPSKDEKTYGEVSLVDGVLIATQYDLPWREDLFDGWHFYDISQSCEFRRKNYKVFIADQYTSDGTPKPWCLHFINEGTSLSFYEKYRGVFFHEYKEFIPNHIKNISGRGVPAISVILLVGAFMDTIQNRMDELERYTSKDCYEVIIVANYIDANMLHLQDSDGLKVIDVEEGGKMAAALNKAVAMAEVNNDIMLLDSRISVSGSITLAVQRAAYEKEDIGAVCCTEGESLPEVWVQSNKLNGVFALFKRTIYNEIGDFDDSFKTLTYTVNDYATRIMDKGYKIIKRNIPGFAMQTNEIKEDVQSDMVAFNEKWSGYEKN